MRAEELRKSSLIRDKESGRIGSVLTIGISKVCCKMEFSKLTQHEDEWEPIPLTEDWLTRLGFELSDDQGDVKYYQIPGQTFGYGISIDHDCLTFYRFHGDNITTLIYDEDYFQYVHHAQNAIHALTNTELTLKE